MTITSLYLRVTSFGRPSRLTDKPTTITEVVTGASEATIWYTSGRSPGGQVCVCGPRAPDDEV